MYVFSALVLAFFASYSVYGAVAVPPLTDFLRACNTLKTADHYKTNAGNVNRLVVTVEKSLDKVVGTATRSGAAAVDFPTKIAGLQPPQKQALSKSFGDAIGSINVLSGVVDTYITADPAHKVAYDGAGVGNAVRAFAVKLEQLPDKVVPGSNAGDFSPRLEGALNVVPGTIPSLGDAVTALTKVADTISPPPTPRGASSSSGGSVGGESSDGASSGTGTVRYGGDAIWRVIDDLKKQHPGLGQQQLDALDKLFKNADGSQKKDPVQYEAFLAAFTAYLRALGLKAAEQGEKVEDARKAFEKRAEGASTGARRDPGAGAAGADAGKKDTGRSSGESSGEESGGSTPMGAPASAPAAKRPWEKKVEEAAVIPPEPPPVPDDVLNKILDEAYRIWNSIEKNVKAVSKKISQVDVTDDAQVREFQALSTFFLDELQRVCDYVVPKWDKVAYDYGITSKDWFEPNLVREAHGGVQQLLLWLIADSGAQCDDGVQKRLFGEGVAKKVAGQKTPGKPAAGPPPPPPPPPGGMKKVAVVKDAIDFPGKPDIVKIVQPLTRNWWIGEQKNPTDDRFLASLVLSMWLNAGDYDAFVLRQDALDCLKLTRDYLRHNAKLPADKAFDEFKVPECYMQSVQAVCQQFSPAVKSIVDPDQALDWSADLKFGEKLVPDFDAADAAPYVQFAGDKLLTKWLMVLAGYVDTRANVFDTKGPAQKPLNIAFNVSSCVTPDPEKQVKIYSEELKGYASVQVGPTKDNTLGINVGGKSMMGAGLLALAYEMLAPASGAGKRLFVAKDVLKAFTDKDKTLNKGKAFLAVRLFLQAILFREIWPQLQGLSDIARASVAVHDQIRAQGFQGLTSEQVLERLALDAARSLAKTSKSLQAAFGVAARGENIVKQASDDVRTRVASLTSAECSALQPNLWIIWEPVTDKLPEDRLLISRGGVSAPAAWGLRMRSLFEKTPAGSLLLKNCSDVHLSADVQKQTDDAKALLHQLQQAGFGYCVRTELAVDGCLASLARAAAVAADKDICKQYFARAIDKVASELVVNGRLGPIAQQFDIVKTSWFLPGYDSKKAPEKLPYSPQLDMAQLALGLLFIPSIGYKLGDEALQKKLVEKVSQSDLGYAGCLIRELADAHVGTLRAATRELQDDSNNRVKLCTEGQKSVQNASIFARAGREYFYRGGDKNFCRKLTAVIGGNEDGWDTAPADLKTFLASCLRLAPASEQDGDTSVRMTDLDLRKMAEYQRLLALLALIPADTQLASAWVPSEEPSAHPLFAQAAAWLPSHLLTPLVNRPIDGWTPVQRAWVPIISRLLRADDPNKALLDAHVPPAPASAGFAGAQARGSGPGRRQPQPQGPRGAGGAGEGTGTPVGQEGLKKTGGPAAPREESLADLLAVFPAYGTYDAAFVGRVKKLSVTDQIAFLTQVDKTVATLTEGKVRMLATVMIGFPEGERAANKAEIKRIADQLKSTGEDRWNVIATDAVAWWEKP